MWDDPRPTLPLAVLLLVWRPRRWRSPPQLAVHPWPRSRVCTSSHLTQPGPKPDPSPVRHPRGASPTPSRACAKAASHVGSLLRSCRPGWRPLRRGCGGRSWSTAWTWRRPWAAWKPPSRGEARRAVRAAGSRLLWCEAAVAGQPFPAILGQLQALGGSGKEGVGPALRDLGTGCRSYML